jgi:hypothetical protein
MPTDGRTSPGHRSRPVSLLLSLTLGPPGSECRRISFLRSAPSAVAGGASGVWLIRTSTLINDAILEDSIMKLQRLAAPSIAVALWVLASPAYAGNVIETMHEMSSSGQFEIDALPRPSKHPA